MIVLVGILSWVLIALFLWEAQWRGRVIILVIVAISLLLPLLGEGDSVHLLNAFGLAIRVAIGCVFLIKQQLPNVS